MSNIYSIDNWAASTNYVTNSIVKNGSYFYYSSANHTSSSLFTTDLNLGLWKGIIGNNNETKPFFTWLPSYGTDAQFEPKVKTVSFSDGYEQSIQDGINNNLLKLDLTFEDRDVNENTAILHFLSTRKGSESFVYIPFPGLDVPKRFKCKVFSSKLNFYNLYTVTCRFDEVVR